MRKETLKPREDLLVGAQHTRYSYQSRGTLNYYVSKKFNVPRRLTRYPFHPYPPAERQYTRLLHEQIKVATGWNEFPKKTFIAISGIQENLFLLGLVS